MKKNPTILMAALTVTAIVLGVIMLAMPARTVEAHMINVQPAVTMLTTGLPNGGEEYLVIMDKAADKLLVYHLVNQSTLELSAAGDYSKIFATGQTPK